MHRNNVLVANVINRQDGGDPNLLFTSVEPVFVQKGNVSFQKGDQIRIYAFGSLSKNTHFKYYDVGGTIQTNNTISTIFDGDCSVMAHFDDEVQ